jgi:hypothetical protein
MLLPNLVVLVLIPDGIRGWQTYELTGDSWAGEGHPWTVVQPINVGRRNAVDMTATHSAVFLDGTMMSLRRVNNLNEE